MPKYKYELPEYLQKVFGTDRTTQCRRLTISIKREEQHLSDLRKAKELGWRIYLGDPIQPQIAQAENVLSIITIWRKRLDETID